MNLIRGQKIRLSDVSKSPDLEVGIQINYTGSGHVRIACLGIDVDNRLSDNRYFIFCNQPASPENALQRLGTVSGDSERFRVNLEKLPSTIKKLLFTVAIDGVGAMTQVSSGYLRILEENQERMRYSFSGSEFSSEKSVILGEIYFKDFWRFAAVGQGFSMDLHSLIEHFGGEGISLPPVPSPPAEELSTWNVITDIAWTLCRYCGLAFLVIGCIAYTARRKVFVETLFTVIVANVVIYFLLWWRDKKNRR